MDMRLCVGEVVTAEELFSGDMVLMGDCHMGIPMFVEVYNIRVEGADVNLMFEGVVHREITLDATTEVLRLEQRNFPFVHGSGGVRTRSADPNSAAHA